ncbi:hypothetical protein GWI33_004041 [Rhynchophorus ferrugineus]|uniref:Uncharacterized protein n=1 Tax=Rhynchophorus ferrugineus TaxID=354439 RepID=A0A834IPZ9_RHYFE|nr:hypothetical protein GWI33_004041 [Rhynchophorus ferrugineus]
MRFGFRSGVDGLQQRRAWESSSRVNFRLIGRSFEFLGEEEEEIVLGRITDGLEWLLVFDAYEKHLASILGISLWYEHQELPEYSPDIISVGQP